MSNKNVRIKVRILGLANELNDRSDPQNRPGRDGAQRKVIIDIPTMELPRDEWDQRIADAEEVLRYGSALDNDRPPIGITDGVEVTGSTTATVHGTAVLTQAISTTLFFEVDSTEDLDSYGSHLAANESPKATVGTHACHSTLIGLTPDTKYAYRLRVSNATGEKYGITRHFKTLAV
ncbi:MAG: hypothetical protein JJE45_00190 [Prolixibacteraceae bacterium]|nr:hypothetical protein [Prolixibacteraceae bacterium]